MYLKLFEVSFIIIGLLSVLQMFLLKLGVAERMKPMKASDFVSSATAVILLYILNALILAVLVSGAHKVVMLFLGAVPFIIGKIAEYKNYEIFTLIQMIIVVCSIIYTICLFV